MVLQPAGEGAVVIKRFHHPHLGAWRDRSRARAEHRALALLHAAGLRVPAPLGVERTPAGWTVRMEHVEGAVSLGSLLHGDEPPPGGWPRLMARLGRLLAGLHGAGVEHTDLHAGNVLVDPLGRAWLIDFHGARCRQQRLEHLRTAWRPRRGPDDGRLPCSVPGRAHDPRYPALGSQ